MSKPETSRPLQLLGGLTTEQFFNEYWQKKPLLIRNAIDNFESLITPDELAGLSLEDQVNARIVIEKAGTHPWQVIYSPFDEEIFSQLPETHWTLLVSDVEKHIPEFADITDQFRFIPDWRIDDLMISYAPEGGSVGPHIDQYDVFLLQAHGQRRWQIGSQPVLDEAFVDGLELRILQQFAPDHDWILHPGDMLYLPPRIAHHGVAVDHCLTYSVGFRANSYNELAESFTDYMTSQNDETQRYNATDFQPHPGEITSDTIAQLKKILLATIQTDNTHIEDWFGQFITEQKIEIDTFSDEIFDSFSAAQQFLLEADTISRHPAIRFAFIRRPDQSVLFINGEHFKVSLDFAECLCGQRHLNSTELLSLAKSDREQVVLMHCLNHGYLF